MMALLAVHLVAAGLAVPAVRRWGARGVLATALAPLAVVVWLVTVVARDGVGATREQELAWVPELGLTLALRLDTLSVVLTAVVAGIGALVLVYSSGYLTVEAPPGTDEAAVQTRTRTRTTWMLVAFAAVMLVLVLADDLLLLYVAWELTTVLSWLLVGGEGRSREERRPALQALLVTTFGGLAMLVGFVVLWHLSGTTRLSAILADPPPASGLLTAAAVLVLVGAVTKSALVPVTAWLPGAMVAPTPVSAYLHAAAMVKAGVYLVARFSPLFADVPAWRVLAVTLGCLTMLVGGWRALRQTDLKLVLAQGTVSQLGFMIALFGAGGRTAAIAGTGMLLAHALFKSTLFLVVGAIDHSAGTRDLRRLSGLARRTPWLLAAAVAAAASMAGVPPLLGFVTKESAFEAFTLGLAEGSPPGTGVDVLVAVVLVVGSALTVAYSARFVWGAFATRPLESPTPWERPSPALVVPPVITGAICLVAGLAPSAVDAAATGVAATAADRAGLGEGVPAAEGYHLALWHGFGLPLLASALALAGGAALFLARDPVARAGTALAAQRLLAAVAPGAVYQRGLRRLLSTAASITKATQRGSLPQYLAGIFTVLVLGPGGVLLAGLDQSWPSRWRLWDDPLQAVAGAAVIAASVGAALTGHRRAAVLMVGASGYGLAALFALGGAPDLALTQVLVETLTLVAFVLVLRRLPVRFDAVPAGSAPRMRRAVRLAVAAAAGAVLALASVVAIAARTATPVSERFARLAVELGGGENVVNVTLVDIRAWDTLGEITVIVVAATGVASLVFLRSRSGAAPRVQDIGPGEGAGVGDSVLALDGKRDLVAGPRSVSHGNWLPAVNTLPTERRSVVLELVARVIFPVVLVLSVYLLFSGHDHVGGGFSGGLVAGLALVLRYVAGGRFELGEALRVPPGVLLGTGLTFAVLAAVVPMLTGLTVLESVILRADVPLLGDLKAVTSTGFDVGVYLIVIGLVLDVLRSLGAEVDRVGARDQAEAEQVRA